MNTNVQKSHNDLIRYFPNGDVQIKLDNILTPNQIVRPMHLLKVEGNHMDVIELISVRNTSEMVYLKIKNQKTGHVGEISTVLDRENDLFVWWVVSYEYVMNALEDRVIDRIKGTENLEFEF
jgi:hypothetical protein